MDRGIHATSSTIAVYRSPDFFSNQLWNLQFINNKAANGSGFYLEVSAKIYYTMESRLQLTDEILLIFMNNHADHGGAIYMADDMARKDLSQEEEMSEYPMAPVQSAKDAVTHTVEISKPHTEAEVTHSVIENPKLRNQSPQPESSTDI